MLKNESELDFQRIVTALHRSGRLAEAMTAYERMLSSDPNHTGALGNLGSIYRQLGRMDDALRCYQRATSQPDCPAEVFYNAANIEIVLGNKERALAYLDQCLARDGAMSLAWRRRGQALWALGQAQEAVAALQCALRLAPDDTVARYDLAEMLAEQGNPELAEPLLRWAIADRPDFKDARQRLAALLCQGRRPTEAASQYLALARLALQEPINVTAQDGADLPRRGDERDLDASVAVKVADGLHQYGHVEAAIGFLRDQIAARPTSAELKLGLARLLNRVRHPSEAIGLCQDVLDQEPENPEAHYAIGSALTYRHQLAQALYHYDRAFALGDQHSGPLSNRLFASLYSDEISPAALIALHRDKASLMLQSKRLPPVTREPVVEGEPLRIGFLTSDLVADHPVAQFLLPVLRQIDRHRFHVYIYTLNAASSATTDAAKQLSHQWRSVRDLSAGAASAMIGLDNLHLLIDLSGHTAGNALPVMALRPGPVQACYIGYPHSTGLATIDYFIGDDVNCPPEHADLFTERLVRPNPVAWCFGPPDPQRIVAQPRPHPDAFVFGSLNTTAKMSNRCLDTWSLILRRCPGAVLLLKAHAFGEPATVAFFKDRLVKAGASPDQVIFSPPGPFEEAMGTYAAIDAVLDTMPYTGGTVTAQALWMGVPVVTRCGDNMCQRLSASFLTAVGLEKLIARSEDEYIDIACQLAEGGIRDGVARRDLRQQAERTFCDAVTYTRNLERAFVAMINGVT